MSDKNTKQQTLKSTSHNQEQALPANPDTNVITGEKLQRDEFGNVIYPTIPAYFGEPTPEPAKRIDVEGFPATNKAAADTTNPGDEGQVVVDQWSVGMANGGMYEIPNTRVRQTYTPEAWERLQKQDFFNQSQMNYKIISGGK
jgi:hypothetical protein